MQLYHIPYWVMENEMTDADFMQLIAVINEEPKKKKHSRGFRDFAKR
jgi:hypothetical protein